MNVELIEQSPGSACALNAEADNDILFKEAGPSARAVQIANILVAVDFSDFSIAALKYAVALAKNLNATLTVIHAVEPYVCPEDLSAGLTIEEVETRWMRSTKEKLEALSHQNIPKDLPATVLVTMGPAWRQVVQTAKAQKVDLIVLGTHGHTGLKHLVLGSTAERVVRHAQCPVLVIHK